MSAIDEIKQRVNCRDLAAGYGVKFRGRDAHCWNAAGHARGDRSASMQIHLDGFKCHGCGISGDALDIVEYFESVDTATALRMLCEWGGIEWDGLSRQTQPGRNPAAQTNDQTRPAELIADVRREILGRVWDCLVFATQPTALFEYGAARGVSEHAMRLTVRDWTAVSPLVLHVLRSGYGRRDLTAAGILKADGEPWFPFAELRRLADDERAKASGFIVPVFDGITSGPVGFRWRFYQPGKLKSLAQPSGAPVLPVGLDSIARARAGGPYGVIVCEGETDWLAAVDAAQVAGLRCAVVSHCTMSAPWRDEWTEQFRDAAAVLIAFDEGNTPIDKSSGEPMPHKRPGILRAGEIAKGLIAMNGSDWYAERVRAWLTPEGGFDLADRHKQNELAPLLNAWTAATVQAQCS